MNSVSSLSFKSYGKKYISNSLKPDNIKPVVNKLQKSANLESLDTFVPAEQVKKTVDIIRTDKNFPLSNPLELFTTRYNLPIKTSKELAQEFENILKNQ